MPSKKPSRRALLGGCLATVVGWLGLGRPTAAAPVPAAGQAEPGPGTCFHTICSHYDAQGNLVKVERFKPITWTEPVLVSLPQDARSGSTYFSQWIGG